MAERPVPAIRFYSDVAGRRLREERIQKPLSPSRRRGISVVRTLEGRYDSHSSLPVPERG